MLSTLEEAIQKNSYKENHEEPFLLASGKRSPYYLDLKQTLFIPKYLHLACRALLEKILNTLSEPPMAAAGLTMGADPLVYGISLLAEEKNINILPLIVRKQTKDHGSQKKVEGRIQELDTKKEIILIDDVVTTGGSTLKAYKALQEIGFQPRYAFCLVDREEGSQENFAKEDIFLSALFKLSDFRSKKS